MDLIELKLASVAWSPLPQDRDHWLPVVNTVISLWIRRRLLLRGGLLQFVCVYELAYVCMCVTCIQNKKDEIGMACSTHKEDEYIRGFGGQDRSIKDR